MITSQISSITSSNLYVDGGGDMAFPALTQFSQPNGAIIQASGSGSVLDLSKLTSLVGATGYSTLSINAQAGGKVNLSKVTGQPSGRIYANAQGTNSIIDFSKLPELLSDAVNMTRGSRQVTVARSLPGHSPLSIAVIFSSTTISRRSPPARSRPSPRRTFTSTAAATWLSLP